MELDVLCKWCGKFIFKVTVAGNSGWFHRGTRLTNCEPHWAEPPE